SSAPECCNNKCIATVAQVSGNCLLKSDGTVWCWGSNTYGQVGDGTTTTRTTPVQVTALGNGNAQISGNGYTNCARTSGGAVWCWGYNATGQLSNGTTSFTPNGVPV